MCVHQQNNWGLDFSTRGMSLEIHHLQKSILLQQLGTVRIDQSRFKIVRGLASIYITLKPYYMTFIMSYLFWFLSKDFSFFPERSITVLE